jgi:ankyrin repeat protein
MRQIDILGKNTQGKSALYYAVTGGYLQNLKILLQAEEVLLNYVFYEDNFLDTILTRAIRFKRLNIINWLLREKIEISDVNIQINHGETALMLSTKMGETQIVK